MKLSNIVTLNIYLILTSPEIGSQETLKLSF